MRRTRRDAGKASLVDFLRSIKYSSHNQSARLSECSDHFAALHPQARQPRGANAEDHELVRSGN